MAGKVISGGSDKSFGMSGCGGDKLFRKVMGNASVPGGRAEGPVDFLGSTGGPGFSSMSPQESKHSPLPEVTWEAGAESSHREESSRGSGTSSIRGW